MDIQCPRSMVGLATTLALTLACGMLAGCNRSGTTDESSRESPQTQSPTTKAIAEVAERVLPSTAEIICMRDDGGGSGSGFIIRGDGLVATSRHVSVNSRECSATLTDGRTLPLKPVALDDWSDIAFMKLAPKETTERFSALRLATEYPRVGQRVIAIGNPMGLGTNVSAGIVSAVHDSVPARELPSGMLLDMVRIDAGINHGNSGGALVNMAGEVVGMMTVEADAEAISDAISSLDILAALQSLQEHGEIRHGRIGIELKWKSETRETVVERVMPGSSGERAGLKPGDVITSISGEKLVRPYQGSVIVARTLPGTTVAVHITRDGKVMSVMPTLDVMPKTTQRAAADAVPELPPSTPKAVALAKCMTAKGIVVFTTSWCPGCRQQKQLFGKEAWAHVTEVPCDVDPQIRDARCARVRSIPTWVWESARRAIGGGPLSMLAQWSDCAYAE